MCPLSLLLGGIWNLSLQLLSHQRKQNVTVDYSKIQIFVIAVFVHHSIGDDLSAETVSPAGFDSMLHLA